MSGTITSPSAPTGGQKVSMFAAKTGFVIPKNKLSGSLVPIFRGGTKTGTGDLANEESAKQAQRKTKWGPDPTQDAAVKKGRALAYQTRVDQITKLLKSGTVEVNEIEESALEPENPDDKSPSPQTKNEVHNSEQLELEKREIIGEILKLNPSYKAPLDYRPLLKEDSFHIPVKEYPGYNFIGLIYGPGGDNQKRLEKETGAKIQICATKAESGEKVEIKPSDGHEIQKSYEQLYVRILADTYDKIDAAISVIELLITSISGNLAAVSATSVSVSGDNANVVTQSQGAPTLQVAPNAVLNQGTGVAQIPVQGHFQYQSPFFPTGPSQTPLHYSSGFISPPSSSTPILNNMVHTSSSEIRPSSMPSLFGPRPSPLFGSNSSLQNSPSFPPRYPSPSLPFQHPYMTQTSPGHMGPPRIQPVMPQQATLSQPSPSAPLPTNLTGSSALQSPRSVSSIGPLPSPLGPSNMGQMGPSMVPPHSRPPASPQSGVTPRGAPLNISTANLNSFVAFQSGPSTPQTTGTTANHPITTQVFSSVPFPQMGPPSVFSGTLRPPTSSPGPAHNPTTNAYLGSAPISLSGTSSFLPQHLPSGPRSSSASMSNFTPLRPPAMTYPRPGDFTFHPHQPQNAGAQSFPLQPAQNSGLPEPQAPSLRQAVHGLTTGSINQVFPRTQVGIRMGQPQIQVSAASHFGPTSISVSPRLPDFFRNSDPQMGPRHSGILPQNFPGGYPPRPGNRMQLQQNYQARGTRPEIPLAPNQQFSSNVSFGKPPSPGGQQIYDPFSPTSVSIMQHGGNPSK